MANRPLLGVGPVPFTAADKLHFVPLTDLSITFQGEVDSSPWRGKNSMLDGSPEQQALDKVVMDLIKRQALQVIAPPSAGPSQALIFRAARDGAAGNNITVSITKVEPDTVTPGNSKLDLTIVETVAFPELSTKKAETAKFVGNLLETGAKPWLVKLQGPVAADVEYPKAGPHERVGGAAEIKVVQKADANKSSFVLVDADGVTAPTLTCVITATDEANNRFAMQVTRTTKKIGAKLSDLVTPGSADANAVKHAIIVEAPGGKPALPEVRDYQLAGGKDSTTNPAVKSSIVIFTTV